MTNKEVKRALLKEYIKVVNICLVLTPIHISYMGFRFDTNHFRAYKSLYIFGLRIARWRVDI